MAKKKRETGVSVTMDKDGSIDCVEVSCCNCCGGVEIFFGKLKDVLRSTSKNTSSRKRKVRRRR